MASGKNTKKRAYCKNKTKGSQKGRKWPEAVRTAAVCDLLVNNNICAVARKHGVPESTLRTWMRAAEQQTDDERKSLFAAERERQVRAVSHLAAQGARKTLEGIVARLERNERNVTITENAVQVMDLAQELSTGLKIVSDATPSAQGVASKNLAVGGVATVVVPTEEMVKAAKDILERHTTMSDIAAATYLRTLVDVSEKAGLLLGDTEAGTGELQVNIAYSGGATSTALVMSDVVVEVND